MFEVRDDFSRYLQSGERIVWTGRPYRGFMFRVADAFAVAFGLPWLLIATAIFSGAMTPANDWARFLIDPLGVLFALIGLYLIWGRFTLDVWARSRMGYALTDRRALIWRHLLEERLISVTIGEASYVRLRPHGVRGDVVFGPPKSQQWRSRGNLMAIPSLDGPTRFIWIEEAAEVYQLAKQAVGAG